MKQLPKLTPASQAWDEATVLVGAMARRLRVDLGSLSAADKIQLISVVVAAWQTFRQQSQHGDSTGYTIADGRYVCLFGSWRLFDHP